MRIDESQAYFDKLMPKLGFIITHDCSVLFVHVSTDRQDTAACVSLSFLYNVKEPEDFVKPSRHQSRQNTTGPSYLAPDVHFIALGSASEGFRSRATLSARFYMLSPA